MYSPLLIIPFGKFKGTNPPTRLKDLPDDYLQFLTKKTKEGTDFVFQSVNWTEAAKEEIKRRASGIDISGPFVDGDDRSLQIGEPKKSMPVDELDMLSGVRELRDTVYAGSIPLERLMDELNPENRDVVQSFIKGVTDFAINDAAQHLLRQWVMRLDKSQKFLPWLKNLGEEAWRYGTHVESGGRWVVKEYGAHHYRFYEGPTTGIALHAIEPKPSEVKSGAG